MKTSGFLNIGKIHNIFIPVCIKQHCNGPGEKYNQ
jgi:hypothetical protein